MNEMARQPYRIVYGDTLTGALTLRPVPLERPAAPVQRPVSRRRRRPLLLRLVRRALQADSELTCRYAAGVLGGTLLVRILIGL
ncbi:MAG TPA: hypothetical protein VGN26_11660 [Armatimonadota bacterium]|jgi:hypothetical protein